MERKKHTRKSFCPNNTVLFILAFEAVVQQPPARSVGVPFYHLPRTIPSGLTDFVLFLYRLVVPSMWHPQTRVFARFHVSTSFLCGHGRQSRT